MDGKRLIWGGRRNKREVNERDRWRKIMSGKRMNGREERRK